MNEQAVLLINVGKRLLLENDIRGLICLLEIRLIVHKLIHFLNISSSLPQTLINSLI